MKARAKGNKQTPSLSQSEQRKHATYSSKWPFGDYAARIYWLSSCAATLPLPPHYCQGGSFSAALNIALAIGAVLLR